MPRNPKKKLEALREAYGGPLPEVGKVRLGDVASGPPTRWLTNDDVAALIRLIDHAEKRGIAFFEGPGGLRFGFQRKAQKRSGGLPGTTGDDWIP